MEPGGHDHRHLPTRSSRRLTDPISALTVRIQPARRASMTIMRKGRRHPQIDQDADPEPTTLRHLPGRVGAWKANSIAAATGSLMALTNKCAIRKRSRSLGKGCARRPPA
jgi:hypothetical protein